MKTVVIKRSRWIRGDSGDESTLYDQRSRKMCCIGFLARRIGCTVQEIADKAYLKRVASQEAIKFNDTHWQSLEKCYQLNDKAVQPRREQKLRAEFRKMGLKLRFED